MEDEVEVGRKNCRVLVVPPGFVVITLPPPTRPSTSPFVDLGFPSPCASVSSLPETLDEGPAVLTIFCASTSVDAAIRGLTGAIVTEDDETLLDPTPIVAELDTTRPPAGRTAPWGLPIPSAAVLPSVTCVIPLTIRARLTAPVPAARWACWARTADDEPTRSGVEACVITRGRVAETTEAVPSVDPSSPSSASPSSSSTCPFPKTLATDTDLPIPKRGAVEEGIAADAERRRNGRIPFADDDDGPGLVPDALSVEMDLPRPRIACKLRSLLVATDAETWRATAGRFVSAGAVVVCERGCLARAGAAGKSVLATDDFVWEMSRYFLMVGVSGAVNLSNAFSRRMEKAGGHGLTLRSSRATLP